MIYVGECVYRCLIMRIISQSNRLSKFTSIVDENLTSFTEPVYEDDERGTSCEVCRYSDHERGYAPRRVRHPKRIKKCILSMNSAIISAYDIIKIHNLKQCQPIITGQLIHIFITVCRFLEETSNIAGHRDSSHELISPHFQKCCACLAECPTLLNTPASVHSW